MNRVIENKKLSGEIQAITSKSYAHRALFCAALAEGESIIEIEDISKDIESSINSIRALGVEIIKKDNKFHIKPPKSFKKNVTIDVYESGTTLRLLLPIIAILGISAKIIRHGTLINRTNSVYFNLFSKHGVNIYEKNECIFLEGKLLNYNFELPGNISSQFISGLLIASGYSSKDFNIRITTEIESKPYICMTIDVMKKFGANVIEKNNLYICKNNFKATNYIVERDWSNALFFLVTGIEVKGLNKNSKQGDKNALKFLKSLGYENISMGNFKLSKIKDAKERIILDAKDMPDVVPILSIISALSNKKIEVINIKRLKLKESDRINSTIEMLNNLGIAVNLFENSFSFNGLDNFKSTTINSYNDHRIAMAASIAATFADGPITIINSQCVEKSYKNFFHDFESLGGITHVI
ncbi:MULTISPECIES: 3-phosphoshikimate 1-carboxyvinyltransferase [Peptoniphilus]|uniref:3-phosphoshikimate 1-carboxyvinyltransferase n=1 Tax=Peptoniphilus TaxID=162289 RepID=UPI00028915D6|nr:MULTISPECIES: 3-phosphoshikimate 1-carboxyvinyltransferase [Peptoniphilus]MDU1044097.1 3-phosphoshikimate 1-carboxyvinyltransferase [Peptoniphilus rhinitidis]MDU3751351.1 3-phosphoshikimate 1-carboxyvinyltransferase [Peptoniphilus rhinitidis]MDU5595318.1 3-phosphoshikimate 1-carboxyvinyltransferase [Peptoniphilus rhinitidis]